MFSEDYRHVEVLSADLEVVDQFELLERGMPSVGRWRLRRGKKLDTLGRRWILTEEDGSFQLPFPDALFLKGHTASMECGGGTWLPGVGRVDRTCYRLSNRSRLLVKVQLARLELSSKSSTSLPLLRARTIVISRQHSFPTTTRPTPLFRISIWTPLRHRFPMLVPFPAPSLNSRTSLRTLKTYLFSALANSWRRSTRHWRKFELRPAWWGQRPRHGGHTFTHVSFYVLTYTRVVAIWTGSSDWVTRT